jgi:hypothetical protein
VGGPWNAGAHVFASCSASESLLPGSSSLGPECARSSQSHGRIGHWAIDHRASSIEHGAWRIERVDEATSAIGRAAGGQRVAGAWRRPLLCAAVMHWIARTASGQISRCKAARWVLPSMSMAIQAIAARAGAPASHVDERAPHRPAGWGADRGVQSAVRSTASSRPQADEADGGQAAKASVKATMGSLMV